MKQLLFLLLFPAYAMAQYPGNAGQKITLGEQTTADGLVWRGRLADTANLLTNKLDTSVYIVLDTGTRAMWYYRASTTPKWTRLVDSLNNLQGTLSVAKGGTGSATQNFVDLTTTQSIGGAKTFTSNISINTSGQSRTISTFYPSGSDGNNIFIGGGGNSSTTGGGASYLGSYNSAIGVNALYSNTTGYLNSAICVNALYSNTTGYNNSAIGVSALYSNTTGYYNSAIGISALYENTTGNNNSAIGVEALRLNTTGYDNSAIGVNALYSNTTGNNNSALGSSAGYGTGTNANTTGSNNTFIGYQSVGESATASNVITLGNSSIATIRSQVTSITSLSDMRDKTNILPLNYGMSFIDKLKPVSFVWDMRDGGKIGISEIGFIAQDLQQAQIDSGINIPNLVSGTDEKLEASYGVLLPIIVKALQEANEKIKLLEQRLLILENK